LDQEKSGNPFLHPSFNKFTIRKDEAKKNQSLMELAKPDLSYDGGLDPDAFFAYYASDLA
jgi:hypothetical protein